MTELLPFDAGSERVWHATASAAAPIITGLFAYAIATTAYILFSLHRDDRDLAATEEQGPRRSSEDRYVERITHQRVQSHAAR